MNDMEKLTLHRPELDELVWRETWLNDPETMSYNHAYGGTIAFPRERWADWYARWIGDEGERYYRYLRLGDSGEFVGNISYHYDGEFGEYMCEVLISAQYRGRGFGQQGLALLCEAAKANGVKRLLDNIAIDNPAAVLFLRDGFQECGRTGEFIFLEKEL